jgi:NADH-quinone oxidoreductase subunit A
METLSSSWFAGYLPLLIMISMGLVVGLALLSINALLAKKPREITPKKFDTYECGVPFEGTARQQFSVRYYMIGIIFLIFDVEAVFLYPWTMVYRSMSREGFFIVAEFLVFALLLLVAYLYLRLVNAFSWD